MDRAATNDPNTALKAMQIMVGALVGGLVVFSAVAAGLVLSGSMPSKAGAGGGGLAVTPAPILLTVMGAMTLMCAAASFGLRAVIAANARKKYEAGEMSEAGVSQPYQMATVLRAALAEGPALFGAVIVMITGNWLGFAGTAFGLLMLLVVFPTRDRRDGFVRDVTGRGPAV